MFSHIDSVPLASASVAQVHAAELRGSGKRVVLKVLKPGVESVLRTDLNFIYLAVQLLQALNPELERTSVTGIVEDIRTSMLDEVCAPLDTVATVQYPDSALEPACKRACTRRQSRAADVGNQQDFAVDSEMEQSLACLVARILQVVVRVCCHAIITFGVDAPRMGAGQLCEGGTAHC